MKKKVSQGINRAATALLAALASAALLVPVASAQTVGPNSFPGTPGAIAFASVRDGSTAPQIYRMNADGFGQTKLSDTPGINWEPAWSPDGKKIAFGNFDFDTSNFEIYEIDADGTDPENLTNAATTEQSPAYSSTSGKLAFTSNRTGNQADVYLATLGASGASSATRITTSPDGDY